MGTDETQEKFTKPGADTPESIRELRERLGLSRRDVELGTSLSSSVVWRAEQVGRKVTDEERTKIWDFLIAFEGEHPEGKRTMSGGLRGKRSPRGEEPKVEALTAAAKHWEKATWDLRHVIDDVYVKAVAALNEAKAKKRSTADLKAIVDALAPHITD